MTLDRFGSQYIEGAATIAGALTVAAGAAAVPLNITASAPTNGIGLVLDHSSGANNVETAIEFVGNAAQTNFLVGKNRVSANTFEIAASTAVGGHTYSSRILGLSAAGALTLAAGLTVTAGGATITGGLGLGIAIDANYTGFISRTFTGTNLAAQLRIQGSITGAVGGDMQVISVGKNTLIEAASGTHGTATAAAFYAPTLTTTGGATTTTASTVYIDGSMAGGTNNYAFRVNAGAASFGGRVLQTQGVDVASTTNLVLGSDGNVFEITGTTKIDLISNLTWQNGSVITLIANESVVIDHGTVTSGTNVQIRLAGAVDYSMTAGDTLTLVLSETTAEGQAWREISRAVI